MNLINIIYTKSQEMLKFCRYFLQISGNIPLFVTVLLQKAAQAKTKATPRRTSSVEK